jgi:hypothetical protein
MTRKQTIKALIWGAVVMIVASFLLFCAKQFLAVRVIGYGRNQSGTELCVVQQPLGSLLETSVYYRKPGSNWGWFYYDHEDWYWARAEIEVDEGKKVMTILRRGEPVATFNWETETYRTDFSYHKGAMDWMPRDFEPQMRRK